MARQRATAERTGGGPRRTTKAKGGDQVQSIIRALTLLNRIAESDDGASLSEVAQQVGLPVSTAHRLLLTLEQERYVRFAPDRRIWTVGVQAFVAGCAFVKTRNFSVGLARPRLRIVMEESGETVNLAVEDRGEAVYLAQVECREIMRVFARPGSRVPMHCSAVGKAIFSGASEKALTKILHQHGMVRLTAKTIVTPTALRQELLKVREQGYAVDDEEHAVGLRCIAAPIVDETGDVIAAVSVSGPMARIGDERMFSLGRMLKGAAHAISMEMGAAASRPLPALGR